jgi:hypothetical protein
MNTYSEGSGLKRWTETYPSIDVSYPVDYIKSQDYIAMLDIVTPNFKSLIARGQIINNPMALSKYSFVSSPGSYQASGYKTNSPTDLFTFVTDVPLSAPFGATSLSWAPLDIELQDWESNRQIALAKAWANVDMSSVQALASLGELPETLHWMASLVKRMISIIRAFTAKRLLLEASKVFRNGTSVLNEMSELWLEFRYAIRPLVYDAQQVIEAWNAHLAKSDRFTARGYNRVALETTTDVFHVDSTIVSRVSTFEANFRAGVLYTVDANINDISANWGLDQPLESVWELIPFSFIVDWFFNVGDVLAAQTANPHLTPLASWVTEELTTTVTDTLVGFDAVVSPSTWTVTSSSWTSGTAVAKQIYKRRLASPYVSKLPRIDINLDPTKLLDLVAIGRNLFASLTRRN